ncbi:hypothetical protein [Haliscomenobacter hydrossis]|uniref:Uncharacterized protein n=1 Tax=Haliscomenobacter hydrossis (strain ATCC 27775 / DSM 1100 / LMG 10767 / O) TaxID=760192 RepID=F4KUS5_HALH1|nr:hypothetical protein [Haliscomenobacter hydrossis]AEE53478.1 hypothetical protein Halhy_5655 [Haliscomenobacter hydrossis DSM 1100]
MLHYYAFILQDNAQVTPKLCTDDLDPQLEKVTDHEEADLSISFKWMYDLCNSFPEECKVFG